LSAYAAHLLVELDSGDAGLGRCGDSVVAAVVVVIAAEVVDASALEPSLVAEVRPLFLAPV